MKKLLTAFSLLLVMAFSSSFVLAQNGGTTAKKQYTLTYEVEGNGSLKVTHKKDTSKVYNSNDKIDEMTEITFTATPEAGYAVKEWYVDDKVNTSYKDGIRFNRQMVADLKVKVVFQKIVKAKVTFTLSPINKGTLTATYKENDKVKELKSGEEVALGTSVNFVVKPNLEVMVDKWIVNEKEDKYAGNKKSLFIDNIQTNQTIQVVLKDKPAVTNGHVVTYDAVMDKGTLSAKVNDIELVSGEKVSKGDEIVFTAKAKNTKYRPAQWIIKRGEKEEKKAPDVWEPFELKVEMGDENIHVSVDLDLPKSKITLESDANGSLTAKANNKDLKSGDFVYNGTSVTFTATPKAGFEVAGWTKTALNEDTEEEETTAIVTAGTSTEYSEEIYGNATYKVTFKKSELVPVTFSAGENGTLTAKIDYDGVIKDINSGEMVKPGTFVNFTAKPKEDYLVKEWLVNGKADPAANELDEYKKKRLSFRKEITEATTITVSFVKDGEDEPSKPKEFLVSKRALFPNLEAGQYVVKTDKGEAIEGGMSVPEGTKLTIIISPNGKPSQKIGYDLKYLAVGKQKITKEDPNLTTDAGDPNQTKYTYTTTVTSDLEIACYLAKATEIKSEYIVTYKAMPAEFGTLKATYQKDGAEVELESGKGVKLGTIVTFKATPKTDYLVESWKVDGQEVNAETSYTMEILNDAILEVTFVSNKIGERKFKVNINPAKPSIDCGIVLVTNEKGESIESGSQIQENTKLILSAEALDGYLFEAFEIDGNKIGIGATGVAQDPQNKDKYTYTFEVKKNTEVGAIFKKDPTASEVIESNKTYYTLFNGTLYCPKASRMMLYSISGQLVASSEKSQLNVSSFDGQYILVAMANGEIILRTKLIL